MVINDNINLIGAPQKLFVFK